MHDQTKSDQCGYDMRFDVSQVPDKYYQNDQIQMMYQILAASPQQLYLQSPNRGYARRDRTYNI